MSVTKTIYDAPPCERLRYGHQLCGATAIRHNETHAWCALCGTKRELPEPPKQRSLMVYEVSFISTDPHVDHQRFFKTMQEFGMHSFEQKFVDLLDGE